MTTWSRSERNPGTLWICKRTPETTICGLQSSKLWQSRDQEISTMPFERKVKVNFLFHFYNYFLDQKIGLTYGPALRSSSRSIRFFNWSNEIKFFANIGRQVCVRKKNDLRKEQFKFETLTSLSFFSASSLKFGSKVLDKMVARCGISIARFNFVINWVFFRSIHVQLLFSSSRDSSRQNASCAIQRSQLTCMIGCSM